MKLFIIIFGLFLVGCASVPGTSLMQSPVSSTSLPTRPDLPFPTETPPLSSPFPQITNTPKVITITVLPSPTTILTETPTETSVSWVYVFPIEPSNIADFSEGTASHGYPATDIFAPEGSKVVAVTNGVINFVSTKDLWNPEEDDPALRGGLSVAFIGDDGVRYYGSHLSAVEQGITPGLRVTAGQLLGYVGHTGDARTTPSHLHFGISRPTFPEDWHSRRGEVDPYPFLSAWLDGHNVTPPLPAP